MNSIPSPANPLIQVLKLLMADPGLRREFMINPGLVFTRLGLGRPADFVGRHGNYCPVMPHLPQGAAATDIRDPYWREWLEGSVEQLRNARLVLANETPFPERTSFASDEEWQAFVEDVKTNIHASIQAWHICDFAHESENSSSGNADAPSQELSAEHFSPTDFGCEP